MRLRWPRTLLSQVGEFASSKSAMKTLAPELRALMIILRSTGPVISTRRSVRSGRLGATVHSAARSCRVAGRKSGSAPASSSRCRATRRASSSRRTGSNRRASPARKLSASGERTAAQPSGAGRVSTTPGTAAVAGGMRKVSLDANPPQATARAEPGGHQCIGVSRRRRAARRRRARRVAPRAVDRRGRARHAGRAVPRARRPRRRGERRRPGLPRAHARDAGRDGDDRASRAAALPRDNRAPRAPDRDVRARGRRVLRGRAHREVASVRQPAGAAHRLRAGPGGGPLQRRRGRADAPPHRVLAGAPQARGPVRPGAALRVPRAHRRRGVRVGDVRRRRAARDVRGPGLHDGPVDPPRVPLTHAATGGRMAKITRRTFAERLALAAAAPFVALDVELPPAAPAGRAAAAQAPQTEPSPLAKTLAEAIRLRYGDRLSPDDLKAVTQAIDSRLRNIDQLYKVALANADEPAFVFAAYRGPA